MALVTPSASTAKSSTVVARRVKPCQIASYAGHYGTRTGHRNAVALQFTRAASTNGGGATGERRGLRFEAECSYGRRVFHDMGSPRYASADKRLRGGWIARIRLVTFLRRLDRRAKTSRQSGRSRCTRHPASPSTCIPSALRDRRRRMDCWASRFPSSLDAKREVVVSDAPGRPGPLQGEIIRLLDGFHHRPETTFAMSPPMCARDKDPSLRTENSAG